MENRPSRIRAILSGIVCAGVAVAIWIFALSGRDKKFTADEFVRLMTLKNEAIGYLENQQFEEALDACKTITELVPKEPFGLSNHVIAWLFQLEDKVGELRREGYPQQLIDSTIPVAQQAQDAVSALLEKHDNSISRLLAARVTLATESISQTGDEELHALALEHLKKGTELNPNDIMVRYAYYEQFQHSDDEDELREAVKYLHEAHKAAPENLWLLQALLPNLAAFKDAEFLPVLAKARELIGPSDATSGPNLREMLDQAEKAAKAGDWDRARGMITGWSNVMRPNVFVQSDQKPCLPHPFDLMLLDFSPSVYSRRPKMELSGDKLPVKFVGEAIESLPTSDVLDFQLADYDLDDRLDFFVLTDGQVEVFGRQSGKGDWVSLQKTAVPTGLNQLRVVDLYPGGTAGAAKRSATVAEITNRPETIRQAHEVYHGLVVYGKSGIHVMRSGRNDKPPTAYAAVPQPAAFAALKNVSHLTLVDLEHDGDLDFVVAHDKRVSLWSNRGNLTFADVSRFAKLPDEIEITGSSAGDLDRDLDTDIVLASPDGGGYLENLRHGRFKWVPFNKSYGAAGTASSVVLADMDGNVSWDLVCVGGQGSRAITTTLPLPGAIKHLKTKPIGSSPGRALLTFDFDNDGNQDVLVWGAGRAQLFRAHDGQFVNESQLFDAESEAQHWDYGDLDQDGDLDLIALGKTGFRFVRNDGGNENHWIDVRVVGDDDTKTGRVNHYGIGSTVELLNQGTYRAQIVTRQTTHFGLGSNEKADYLRLLLTNGIPQGIVAPAKNLLFSEPQVLLGSCPFLYTFDGKKYEFYTDCLWGAPLGLQVAEGVQAPWRSWEYLRIPGEKLKAVNGKYRLKMTEELWEAVYFDLIHLIAVDHPADTEIYSNEKVGPASIAAKQIHTVRKPRLPVAITDSRGIDLMPKMAKRDGEFAQPFKGRIRQGLVDAHHVEIDLGKLENPKSIKLFLHGWIHPADSSLNVAFSQNPDLDAPVPPSLQVKDADGNWKTSRPFMGFPPGKPKTIVFDLSDAFLTDDYKLRIATSCEIYWDSCFFTVDEKSVPLKERELLPSKALLKYRGFSALLPRRPSEPHRYDHETVTMGPQWPTMSGNFTRYGDVRELLLETDDRMVVMGAGDAMELEFDAPPAPPKGWKRTFLIYNDGWDKDANVNTIHGDQVEPLPFHAMKDYPYEPRQHFPQSPAHKDYLRRYQNRQQSPRGFWRLPGGEQR